MPLTMRREGPVTHVQAGAQAGPGRTARIPPPRLIVSRVFPGRAEHVRQARRWVRAHLPPCPATEDLEAIASELAANAVLHTASGHPGGVFEAWLAWSPERARIVIADGGSPTAPALVIGSTGERQRGLAVVDGLAASWRHCGGWDRRWTWADVAWDGPVPDAPGGLTSVGAELGRLRAAHPGVWFWYGEHTGTWWAASGRGLLDAPCPAALTTMATTLAR